MASYTESALQARGIIGYEPVPMTAGVAVNSELVQGAGVVTPPADARFSRPYASLRAGSLHWSDISIRDAHRPAETLRQCPTYGWAVSPFGESDTATLEQAAREGSATVLVHAADGTITIRAASEFRRASDATQHRQASAPSATRAASDIALMADLGITAADVDALAQGIA